jgi:hypothetical protein
VNEPIVECECGARVRLRESARRQVRCPKCSGDLALTHDGQVVPSFKVTPGETQPLCPICQTGVVPEELCVSCPECEQTHHRECWWEMAGCGTYGCKEAPAVEKSETAVDTPLAAWGDTKNCPACGEEIKSIALRCRFCKTDFDTVDPLTVTDLRRQVVRDEKVDKLQKSLVATFVVSLIGCLAPLMLIVSCVLVLPNRERLAKFSPLYWVMGYASLGLSAIYTVLMLLFFLAEL